MSGDNRARGVRSYVRRSDAKPKTFRSQPQHASPTAQRSWSGVNRRFFTQPQDLLEIHQGAS